MGWGWGWGSRGTVGAAFNCKYETISLMTSNPKSCLVLVMRKVLKLESPEISFLEETCPGLDVENLILATPPPPPTIRAKSVQRSLGRPPAPDENVVSKTKWAQEPKDAQGVNSQSTRLLKRLNKLFFRVNVF